MIPPRSGDLLSAQLGNNRLVYDLAEERGHILNPTAAVVFDACDGETLVDDVASAFSSGPDGSTTPSRAEDVARVLAQFGALGLTNRAPRLAPLEEHTWSHGDAPIHVGAVHAVLDRGVQFRSDSESLLATVDSYLNLVDLSSKPSVFLDLIQEDGGWIRLDADTEWRFPSISVLLDHLVVVVNEYATRSSGNAVLHAAAVRSPAGALVVLLGASGVGKSTLAASLIQRGWEYATDEAVGLHSGGCRALGYAKPLSLDQTSRRLLGLSESTARDTDPAELRPEVRRLHGDAGAITAVVLPRFVSGTAIKVTWLDQQERGIEVLRNSVNIRRVGEDGLHDLCALAESRPMFRLEHGDALEAAATIEAVLDSGSAG